MTVVAPAKCSKYCSLTISHTQVKESGKYALLLNGSGDAAANTGFFGTRLPDDLFANCQTDGGDVCFTDGNFAQIPCEIVGTLDTSNKKCEIWVPVTLSTTADTVIYVWYKSNSGTLTQPAVDAANGKQAVWSTIGNIVGVWHFGTAASLDVSDSTGVNTGTNNGATASAAKVGGAASLDGSHWVNIGSTGFPSGTNPSTFYAWVKPTSLPGYAQVLGYGQAGSYQARAITLHNNDGSGNFCIAEYLGNSPQSANQLAVGQWSAITASVSLLSGTTFDVKYTFNGAADSGGGNLSSINTVLGSKHDIGHGTDWGANNFNGQIDEVRVHSVARSQNYSCTEYAAHASANLITVGTPAVPPVLQVSDPVCSAYSDTEIDVSSALLIGTPTAYQWHRSETNGFTPVWNDASTILAGTSLSLADTTVVTNHTYYYRLMVTDGVTTYITGQLQVSAMTDITPLTGGSSSGANSATVTIDTSTGAATSIFALVSCLRAAGITPVPTDTYNNTWIKISETFGYSTRTAMYYALCAGKTGASHAITVAASGGAPGLAVQCFKGLQIAPVYVTERHKGFGPTNTSVSSPYAGPGVSSYVPGKSLFLAGLGTTSVNGSLAAASASAGYSVQYNPWDGAKGGAALAWKVNTGPTYEAVSWAWTGAAYAPATIGAVFSKSAIPSTLQTTTLPGITGTNANTAPVADDAGPINSAIAALSSRGGGTLTWNGYHAFLSEGLLLQPNVTITASDTNQRMHFFGANAHAINAAWPNGVDETPIRNLNFRRGLPNKGNSVSGGLTVKWPLGLASAINDSATTMTLGSNQGHFVSYYDVGWSYGTGYFLDITDGVNTETVLVTNVSTDTLTIVRAQLGTTARSWNATAWLTDGSLDPGNTGPTIRETVIDHDIAITNLTCNCHGGTYTQPYASFWWCVGLGLSGFKNVTLTNVKLIDSATFGFLFAYGDTLHMPGCGNYHVDYTRNHQDTGIIGNDDSIHIWGPMSNVTVSNFFGQNNDNTLALNWAENEDASLKYCWTVPRASAGDLTNFTGTNLTLNTIPYVGFTQGNGGAMAIYGSDTTKASGISLNGIVFVDGTMPMLIDWGHSHIDDLTIQNVSGNFIGVVGSNSTCIQFKATSSVGSLTINGINLSTTDTTLASYPYIKALCPISTLTLTGGTWPGTSIPAKENVLAGTGAYGTVGNLQTPSLTLPLGSSVATGSGAYGVGGNSITPSYPTTATTQAADAATLTAKTLNADGTDTTVTFGASGGTAKSAAVYAAGSNARLATDQSTVLASAAYILTGHSILGQTGTYVSGGTVPSAADVRSGVAVGSGTGTLVVPSPGMVAAGTATDNTTGTYPLTATTQAAQLATDQAAVAAAAAYIATGQTILGQAGSYPTTAATQEAQLATDQAAVAAGAAYIVTGQTILGHAGSYPTTATSQAAQLATDRAAVAAATSQFYGTILGLTGMLALPAARYVYAGVNRGDGVTGTLRASTIAAAAGAGVNLSASILLNGSTVDDIVGSATGGEGGGSSYASGQADQLAIDQATVAANVSYILAGHSILGQTGNYTGSALGATSADVRRGVDRGDGVLGTLDLPLAAEVEFGVTYDNGTKVGTFTSNGVIVYSSPVSGDGATFSIIQGNDYLISESTPLSWKDPGWWPDLSAATHVYLNARDGSDALKLTEYACSVIPASGGSPQRVIARPTHLQTNAMPPGSYVFDIQAIFSDGGPITLVQGSGSVTQPVRRT